MRNTLKPHAPGRGQVLCTVPAVGNRLALPRSLRALGVVPGESVIAELDTGTAIPGVIANAPDDALVCVLAHVPEFGARRATVCRIEPRRAAGAVLRALRLKFAALVWPAATGAAGAA